MKRSVLIVFAFAFCLSTALSGQVLDYSVARTDHDPLPGHPIVPGSVWGGAMGMGTKWCFPNNGEQGYNGICIWRITDASVFSGGSTVQTPDDDAENPVTVQTDSGQRDNIISAPSGDTRYIIVRATNGASRIIAFNSKASTAMTQAAQPSGEMMFDETNAGNIYARVNKTQIVEYTSNDGWSTNDYTTRSIYDFANCLPQGFQVKWTSSWATALPTNTNLGISHTWGTAFSEGDQGTGYLALAYREPVLGQGGGCASIDTLHDLAYGWNGELLGPLDDGNGNALPSFNIHDGGMTRNPNFFAMGPAQGCGNCAARIYGK